MSKTRNRISIGKGLKNQNSHGRTNLRPLPRHLALISFRIRRHFTFKAITMAETKKERIESLKKELSIRKNIVETNARICVEIVEQLLELESA
jgi:hypothetical protein